MYGILLFVELFWMEINNNLNLPRYECSAMRKTLSILFLLLAGMILLAHDFIPHQHHEDHICFENSSCHAEHDSEPSSSEDEPCCMLDNIQLVAPADHLHYSWCSCCDSPGQRGSAFHALMPLLARTPDVVTSTLLFRKHPSPAFSYAGLALQCQGLRAPPLA